MKVTKPLKNGGRKLAFAFACALAGFASCVAVAEDLTLAAGETLTISDSRTYDTITVNGTLTISGSGASVTATTVRVAEGANTNGVLTVTDGASLTVTGERNGGYQPFTVAHARPGTGNAIGTLNVLNGATITTHDMLLGNMASCGSNYSIATVNVSNSTVTIQAYLWHTRDGNYGNFTYGNGYPVTVTLYEGALLETVNFVRNADGKVLYSFRGGRLKSNNIQTMDGGTLVFSGDDGHPIDVESKATGTGNALVSLTRGSSNKDGHALMTGTGGMTIRGSVWLDASKSGGGNPHEYLTSDFSGPLTLLLPGIRQMAKGQLASGNCSLVLSDDVERKYDLNGFDAAFTSIHEGIGCIRNTSTNAATLTIGGDGSNGELNRLSGPMSLRKEGGGTWAVKTINLADIAVMDGTLNLSVGCRYWKFASTEVYGPNHIRVQLSGVRFLDAAGDEIDLSKRVSTGGSGESININALFDNNPISVTYATRPDGADNATYSAWICFSNAQYVSAYTWSTAHDYGPDTKWEGRTDEGYQNDLVPPQYDKSYCRDPSAWTLEASTDGSNWTVIDSQSGFKAINRRYTYNTTNFACTGYVLVTGAVHVVNRATLNVAQPVTLAPTYWQNDGTVNLAAGCRFAVDETAAARFYNVPVAAVEKSGVNAVTAQGGTFSNSVHVSGGTLTLSGNDGISSKYWRWRIKKLKGWWEDAAKGRNEAWTPNSFQARGLALYDRNGARVNAVSNGATVVSADHSAFKNLLANNQSACFVPVEHSDWGEGTVTIPVPDPENEETWSGFVFKLSDSVPSVYSYAFATGGDHTDRDAVSWDFSVSDDGTTWTVIEDRADEVVGIARASWIAYNGGFRFPFASTSDVSAFAAGTEVQVDGGATLAFAGTSTVIDSLKVDVGAGCGTLTHFNPAANGELRLENVPTGVKLDTLSLLTVGVAVNEANLSSWKVLVGEAATPYKLALHDGRLVLLPAGMMIIFR